MLEELAPTCNQRAHASVRIGNISYRVDSGVYKNDDWSQVCVVCLPPAETYMGWALASSFTRASKGLDAKILGSGVAP